MIAEKGIEECVTAEEDPAVPFDPRMTFIEQIRTTSHTWCDQEETLRYRKVACPKQSRYGIGLRSLFDVG